jgi:hypothetical protein
MRYGDACPFFPAGFEDWGREAAAGRPLAVRGRGRGLPLAHRRADHAQRLNGRVGARLPAYPGKVLRYQVTDEQHGMEFTAGGATQSEFHYVTA